MTGRRRISPEDRLTRNKAIVAHAAAGATYEEMAIVFGLSRGSVKNLCSRLGVRVISARKRRAIIDKCIVVERVKAGVTYRAIATELNMHVGSIRRLSSKAGVVRWKRRKEASP